MATRTEAPIRSAAERAAAEVYEKVRQAAYDAAREAVQQAIETQTGVRITLDDVTITDRMPRAEAARRLGVTQQMIMRLENKGAVAVEREGRTAYVRLSEVEDALRRR